MAKDFTFADVKKYLKKFGEDGKEAIEALDALTDAAIIFSPVIFGPQLLPLLSILDTKDRIIKLSKFVYDRVTKKLEPNYIDRAEQLSTAYGLISFTAYFEALSGAFSPKIRKILEQEIQEAKTSLAKSSETSETMQSFSTISDFYADHMNSYSSVKTRLFERYQKVSSNLIRLVEKTCYNNQKISQKDLDGIKGKIKDIPKKAIEIYEAQCLSLATEFTDYALLAEFMRFDDLDLANEQAIALLEKISSGTEELDVGLKDLHTVISSLPQYFDAIKSQEVLTDLKNKYDAIIQEPIIDDKEIKAKSEKISLMFPKIVDAYIPQSYKCLSYKSSDIELEDVSIWEGIEIQKNLNSFILKYLRSPDCIDYPLIILGQPGSGKSLLTKVLSAQLTSDSCSVIRIPLREINADSNIDVLVEDQIKKITTRTINYADFAKQFKKEPLTIILDGYDELLQAKGEVFSGYLERIRTFQQDQKDLKRPVRIIITSRITLIDKARVPINSTILRLMEFDQEQQKAWIDIWNESNKEYFKTTKIKDFKIPTKGTTAAKSIQTLAQQPLLLLMLAIYDSESNELAKNINIKRTELYNNLIRRFIRRERRRYVARFEDKLLEQQESIIDEEMMRLGVVAMGMYNRQEVVIRSEQLEEDLNVFDAHREEYCESRALKESESVLGGFFFIHKSTAQEADAHSDKATNAYEFLHNTFGEFLAADFILKNAIRTLNNVYIDRVYKKKLTVQLDSVEQEWYYCLMYVPLYSRPVIIEMMREHIDKVLTNTNTNANLTKPLFLEYLHYLVHDHLNTILNTNTIPKEFCEGIRFDRELSLLGHLSTYTINLIILASVLSPEGYTFVEKEYGQLEEVSICSRPWEKLTSLWKSWFSQTDLMGLSVILRAQKGNDGVLIKCNETFEATRYEQPIDIDLCVSHTLGDILQTGLAGMQTQRFCEVTRMSQEDIHEMLKNENPDLYISYLVNSLKKNLYHYSNLLREQTDPLTLIYAINELLEEIIDANVIHSINTNNLVLLLDALGQCITQRVIFIPIYKKLIDGFSSLLSSEIQDKTAEKKQQLSLCSRFYMRYLIPNPWIASKIDLHDILVHDYDFRSANYRRQPTYEMYRMISRIDSSKNANKYTNGERLLLNCVLFLSEGSIRKADMEFIECFSNINPEIISRVYLELIKLPGQKTRMLTAVNTHLKTCCAIFEDYGLGYLGENALICALTLAKKLNIDWFITKTTNIMHAKYFYKSRYDSAFSSCPGFISDYISLFPEEFSHKGCEYFLYLFERYDHDYIRIPSRLILDVVKLIHTLNSYIDLHKYVNRSFDYLHEQICKVDVSTITLAQTNDLLWWASFMDDEKLLNTIRKFLDS